MAQDIGPDVTTATVVPSEGSIVVVTPEGAFVFVCGQDKGGWNLIMANVLVGLGFYKVTSQVPMHLIDPFDNHQSYILVKPLG
jgi:hypothetical protein